MRFTTDAKVALALLAFCALMLWGTFRIEPHPYISMAASVFPRVILALLIPLCLALLVKGLRQPPGEAPSAPAPGLGAWAWRYRTVLVSFALFFLLVLLMPWLGFLLTGALYLASMLWVLGPRSPRQVPFVLLVAIGFAGGIYLVFRYVLYVIMPEGVFF